MSDLKTKEDYNLDYIGIPWKNPEHWYLDTKGDVIEGQTNIFDFIGEEDTE